MATHILFRWAMVLGGAWAGMAGAHDGLIDASFGTMGTNLFQPIGNQFLMPTTVVAKVDPATGKIIVRGTANNGSGGIDIAVMRLTSDGQVDASFGFFGSVRVPFDPNNTASDDSEVLADLLIQPDGKILLTGWVDGLGNTEQEIGIARLNAAGTLDNGFGNGGKVVTGFDLGSQAGSRGDLAKSIALQADGKIAVLATVQTDAGTTMGVVRLNADGTPDLNFDLDGRAIVQFGTVYAEASRIRQTVDGGLVAVGGTTFSPQTGLDFALAKLDSTGVPDAAFGEGGVATFGFDVNGGSKDDFATDFAIDPDGSLLVCGLAYVSQPSNADFACAKFSSSGAPDASFAPVLIPFDQGGALTDVVNAVERDAEGRYLLAGAASSATKNADFAAVRLLRNGALDSSFGVKGRAFYPNAIGNGVETDNAARAVAIQDGKIILAGYAASKYGSGNYIDYKFAAIRVSGDTLFEGTFEP